MLQSARWLCEQSRGLHSRGHVPTETRVKSVRTISCHDYYHYHSHHYPHHHYRHDRHAIVLQTLKGPNALNMDFDPLPSCAQAQGMSQVGTRLAGLSR
jgi:hypothetical protein